VSRLTILCAAFACAACASAKSGAPVEAPTPPTTVTPLSQRVTVASGQTISINTVDVNQGVTTLVLAPLDSSWTALKAVYADLGIPVTTIVDATHLIGNEGYKTRRRIETIPMRSILDCGGAQGLQNAETYDIFLSISSYLVKNPKAGYNLVTRIDATAKSPNFNREQNVKCSSQGELERKIGELVRKKTGY
jgi:hypothetical protein